MRTKEEERDEPGKTEGNEATVEKVRVGGSK